jgi:probable F420-dependent oxidoreductase
MGHMKVGVQLPEVERDVAWRDLAEMARAAEASGLDSVWVGDHLLYRDPPRGPWEAWTLLAAIAAVTSRVEIGPLVACLGFHNPAMLAKKVATLDEISGGRLVLGIGAGWNRDEFDAFGFPFDARVDRFSEAFTIIRRLLDGEEVTFEGSHHSVRDCVLLPRPARRPPLMVGSRRPRMLSITLPHVDMQHAWFTAFGNHPDGIPDLRRRVDEVCREVGRDPATVERSVALYVQLAEGRGRVEGNPSGRRTMQPIHLGQLSATLAALAREGVVHVQLVIDPITTASIERVGNEIGAM